MNRAVLALTIALAATRSVGASVTPHFVMGDAYCDSRVGIGPDGFQLPLVGGVNVTPLTTPDGETGSFVTCGVVDAYFWNPGPYSQYFAVDAGGRYMVLGKVGVLRGYAYGYTDRYPVSYGPPFVPGTNPYNAYSSVGSGASFVDVITPPPTTAAPNAGQSTSLMLKPILDADCMHYLLEPGTDGFIIISFYQPDQYPDDDHVGTPLFTTHILRLNTTLGPAVCPANFDPRPVDGLTVGQPVVMRVDLGISSGAYIDQFQAPTGFYGELSLLSTATAILTTTDGDPVVGASGHSYTTVDPVPDLTPPTITSTTEPVATTTTTLPGCGGKCGDGAVDAACGEACDCPPAADPVMAGFGCAGSDVVPPQPACVVCRGCQLLAFCGDTTPTTTTTVPSGGTTTTSTTAPAGGCGELAGFAGMKCVCDEGVAPAACDADHVPGVVGKLFTRGCTSMQRAAELTRSKKVKKVVHTAGAEFAKALVKVTMAAAAKKHPLSPACSASLTGTLGDAKQRTGTIGAGL